MPVSYPTAYVRLHLRLEDFGQPEPDKHITLEHAPIELQWTRNAWFEADTIKATLDLEDFPLDPRILRGATIEAFLADAGSTDARFWSKLSNDELAEHAVFAGIMDEIETGIDDEWRKTIVKGRDYTAFFLDIGAQSGPVSYVEGGRKLSLREIIERVVYDPERPNTHALQLVIDPDCEDIFPADYKGALDSAKQETPRSKRRKREGESVWELLYELALEAGCILYVHLDQIRLRKPSTIFVTQSLDESLWYRWALGSNLKRLAPSRQMGRRHGINVRVTSLDSDAGKRLVAVAPEDPLRAEKAEVSAARVANDGQRQDSTTSRVVFRPFVVRNILDQQQLQEIADQLYELLREHELEGTFETDDLVDSKGRSVLQIGYGDPVVFDVAESFQSILSLDQSAQLERLLQLAYPPDVARKVSIAMKSPRVPFYFHKLEHRFTSEDEGGYSLTAEIRSRKQVEIGPQSKRVELTLEG